MFFSDPFRQKRIANRTRKWDVYDLTVRGSNVHSQGAITAFMQCTVRTTNRGLRQR
jgi:hypothetical protein